MSAKVLRSFLCNVGNAAVLTFFRHGSILNVQNLYKITGGYYLMGAYGLVAEIIGIVLAIAATVLAYIFLVPEKAGAVKNKLVVFLHNLINFKSLLIEKILKALYIFSTAFCLIAGFLLLFWVVVYDSYYGIRVVWNGWVGLLLMVVGPIAVRLAYESLMLIILLVKNVIDIRNRMYGEKGDDAFSQPLPSFKSEPAAPAAPVYTAPVTPTEPTAPTAPQSPEQV